MHELSTTRSQVHVSKSLFVFVRFILDCTEFLEVQEIRIGVELELASSFLNRVSRAQREPC